MKSKGKTGESGPRLSAEGAQARDQRKQREAEALRANLLKRKAQSRGRSAPAGQAMVNPAAAPPKENAD
jgi:hypothetical protein